MKNANPAPIGVMAFGVAAFVVGGLFAGLFGAFNAGNMHASAYVALISGLVLLLVTCLMISGNSLADSAVFSMWGATIFGFFGQVWIVLGLILLNWTDGVTNPLAYMLLYLCLFSIGYLIYSYKLKLWSFALLFLLVAVATLSAFAQLIYGWSDGNMVCGYIFILLSFLAIYIAFKEQLSAVLPAKE